MLSLSSVLARPWKMLRLWVRKDSSEKIIGDQMVAKRKGEKFKRIKGSTLAKLLQESNNDESVYNLAENQMAGL